MKIIFIFIALLLAVVVLADVSLDSSCSDDCDDIDRAWNELRTYLEITPPNSGRFFNPATNGWVPESVYLSRPETVAQSPSASTASTTKTFTLTGKDLKFFMDGVVNPDLHVKLNDRVTIKFSSQESTPHNWYAPGFTARTVNSFKDSTFGSIPVSVEFVANKVGTFEYYCEVGDHKQMGMKGNLIVET